MVETQTIAAEGERLASDFSRELLVWWEYVASSAGNIELRSHREGDGFGPVLLSTSTSSARGEPRFTSEQVRRLAADVRAKVQAHASSIDSSARIVVVTIYPRRGAFDIDVTIIYR